MFKVLWLLMTLAAFNAFASDNYFDDYLTGNGFHKMVFPHSVGGKVVDRVTSIDFVNDKTFRVSSEGGNVVIDEIDGYYNKDDVIVRFEGYEFKGYDNGEWGGRLVVKYNNNDTENLLSNNIVDIIPGYESLYVFSGLTHLFASTGDISVIKDFTRPLKVERFTLLPWAPDVALFDVGDGLFTVVGDTGIAEVFISQPFIEGGPVHSNDTYMNVYFVNNDWGGMYPNSAVRKGSFILIGMRNVVAVVEVVEGLLGVGEANVVYYTKNKMRKKK